MPKWRARRTRVDYPKPARPDGSNALHDAHRMTLATALLMAVVQLGVLPEEWHKLTSSEQTAAGIDTRSIQRSGDDISARMLVAMRVMDESTKRIAASYVVARVTVNCRTRAGRMTVGPL